MSVLNLEAHIEYHEAFLSREVSKAVYKHIHDDFKINQHRIKIGNTYSDFGKIMFIDRDLYDSNRFPEFAYGKSFIWSEFMMSLKQNIELFTGHSFQVCVCIFYPDGNSGVGFHFDPPSFGDTSYLPSLSLGEERLFYFRHKITKQIHELTLQNGSMVIMGDRCQENYEHCLPTNPIYKNGRINLTFRKYGFH